MARKFKKVNKTKKGVPTDYLKGSKNPSAREKEILRTRSKYLKGKMTSKDYEAVEKARTKDKVKMKKGGSVPACVKKYAKSSGKSTSTLMKVYKRGQGAYFSSGSRPGQSSHSWGCGRVRSFATRKGGARKADKDLLRGGKKKKKMDTGGAASNKFPDFSGDGKITKKDILMGRGVIPQPNKKMKNGGEVARGCGAIDPKRKKKTKYF